MPTRVSLDRVNLDPVTMDEAIEIVSTVIRERRPRAFHVVTPNAQFVEIARRDARFGEIVRAAGLSVADGVPLVWSSRLLGAPLPGRVNGTDLMVRLCEEAADQGHSVYFLGGRPGAAEQAARSLAKRFPGLNVIGTSCPPMGFADQAELDAEVVQEIERMAPDLLFVGLGAPKQEYWIYNHLGLPARVMVGIGGSFELIAGLTKRAPLPLQKVGLEWMWRLLMEPRRLWRRYLVGNSLFISLVIRLWLAGLLLSGLQYSPVRDLSKTPD